MKAIFSKGYRLITWGATIGDYQLFQTMIDIKKLGIEWLDTRSSTWQWYMFGFIFVGFNSLQRKAFHIPPNWQPPHLTRALCTGAAMGWIFHLGLWLLIGR